MMTDLDFDGLLDSTLAGSGPQVAPTSLGDVIMDGVRVTRQRRPRVRALDLRAWPAPRPSLADPATARALRVLVAAVLMLTIIATSVFVGSRFLEPDDDWELVFGSAAGGLYVADLDGAPPRLLAADGMYVEPRVSPDGRWIAADYIPSVNAFPVRGPTIDRRLVILRADGTNVVDLPSLNPAWGYSWGATGGAEGWLAAALDESVVVVDPATGSRLTIPLPPESYGAAIAWSPEAPVLWWVVRGPISMPGGIDEAEVHAVGIHSVDGTLQAAGERSFRVRLDSVRAHREVERIAVSPDGQTLAFRIRNNRMFRSDVALVWVGGGVPATYLNPGPPGEPFIGARSGIRWTPDGRGVVVEVGDMVEVETSWVRPAILPIDGTLPRPIDVGPVSTDAIGGTVTNDGPVLPTDMEILVGGAQHWADQPGGQVAFYDLWLANARGEGSRLIVTGTFGGDLR